VPGQAAWRTRLRVRCWLDVAVIISFSTRPMAPQGENPLSYPALSNMQRPPFTRAREIGASDAWLYGGRRRAVNNRELTRCCPLVHPQAHPPRQSCSCFLYLTRRSAYEPALGFPTRRTAPQGESLPTLPCRICNARPLLVPGKLAQATRSSTAAGNEISKADAPSSLVNLSAI
jgi:hypothetical protein